LSAESASLLDAGVASGLAPVGDDHPAGATGWREQPSPNGSVPAPGLPRRSRQASLAPQLKEDGRGPADGGRPDASDGLSPGGSRALAESLQHAFDRARAVEGVADGSSPSDGAWPSDAFWPAQSRPGGGRRPAEPSEAVGLPEEPGAQ